jgi:CheY-like chemotaxis protein
LAKNLTFAIDGENEVDEAKKKVFDIILMDIMMPKLNGHEATKRIRELGITSSKCQIIALTANVTAQERERCTSAGMDGFVAKPMGSKELKQEIWACYQKLSRLETKKEAS